MSQTTVEGTVHLNAPKLEILLDGKPVFTSRATRMTISEECEEHFSRQPLRHPYLQQMGTGKLVIEFANGYEIRLPEVEG